MTGITHINRKNLDQYFSIHYQDLLYGTKRYFRIADIDDCPELLNNTYLLMIDKILRMTGETITNIGAFVRSFIKVHALKQKMLKPVRTFIDVNDIDVADNETNNQELHNYNEREQRRIFNFVQHRFDERSAHFFTRYYFDEYKDAESTKRTYAKIAADTGYSYSTIEKTIRLIKADIRNNFNRWKKKMRFSD